MCASVSNAANYQPAQVEAAVLFHLSSYLHRDQDGSALNRYCVVSQGAVESALGSLLATRSKAPLQKIELNSSDNTEEKVSEKLARCDILFTGDHTLSQSFDGNIANIVIVGKGQEIEVTTEAGKVVMYVSLEQLTNKGIIVNSKLLRVARIREE
jgi:hypothetical protein